MVTFVDFVLVLHMFLNGLILFLVSLKRVGVCVLPHHLQLNHHVFVLLFFLVAYLILSENRGNVSYK